MSEPPVYQSFDDREITRKIDAMNELGLDWTAKVIYINEQRAYELKSVHIAIPRESLTIKADEMRRRDLAQQHRGEVVPGSGSLVKPSEDPLPSGEDDTD